MSAFPPTLFSGKRFAVVGLGKNGLPVAQRLRAMGADVVAWDDNPAALQAARETTVAPRPKAPTWRRKLSVHRRPRFAG